MRYISKAPRRTGVEEVRSGFLLFPKTIKGETRWLEKARWMVMSNRAQLNDLKGDPVWFFKDWKWIDEEDTNG